MSLPDRDAPIPIAIAVVERDDHFLIAPRSAGQPLAGCWEFPGGKVLPGERPDQAAVRECREETGLEVEVLAGYPDCVQNYPHGTVHLHFFACRPMDRLADPAAPWRWVSRRALGDYAFPDGNREMLHRLMTVTGIVDR